MMIMSLFWKPIIFWIQQIIKQWAKPATQSSIYCYQPIATNSFSQSNDFSCGFRVGHDNVNLMIYPLGYRGGFTQTIMLGKDSPAIYAKNYAGFPTADLRGVARPQIAALATSMRSRTPRRKPYLINSSTYSC
jgi:hypothetical protein